MQQYSQEFNGNFASKNVQKMFLHFDYFLGGLKHFHRIALLTLTLLTPPSNAILLISEQSPPECRIFAPFSQLWSISDRRQQMEAARGHVNDVPATFKL